jgi:hypothetical protein
VDIDAVHRWAKDHRDGLARRLNMGKGEVSASDLDQALALLGLFRAGYLTSEGGPEFTSVHLTIGLVNAEPR